MANNFEREPFRPSGSPLADKIAQAIDADLAAQAAAPIIKAEQERLAEEERLKKVEEMRQRLTAEFEKLDARRLLTEVQAVWQGGEVQEEPTTEIRDSASQGKISLSLVYGYDDIRLKIDSRILERKGTSTREEITRTNYVGEVQEVLTVSLSTDSHKPNGLIVEVESKSHRGKELDGFFKDVNTTDRLTWFRLSEAESIPGKIEEGLVRHLKTRAFAGELPITSLEEEAKKRIAKYDGRSKKEKPAWFHEPDPIPSRGDMM